MKTKSCPEISGFSTINARKQRGRLPMPTTFANSIVSEAFSALATSTKMSFSKTARPSGRIFVKDVVFNVKTSSQQFCCQQYQPSWKGVLTRIVADNIANISVEESTSNIMLTKNVPNNNLSNNVSTAPDRPVISKFRIQCSSTLFLVIVGVSDSKLTSSIQAKLS